MHLIALGQKLNGSSPMQSELPPNKYGLPVIINHFQVSGTNEYEWD